MIEERPVLIMAGGTGGHVMPALVVAERFRDLGIPVIWMGTQSGFESILVPKAGIKMELIRVEGLRGASFSRLLEVPLMLGRTLWKTCKILRRLNPRVVLGMGGFTSGPGGIAAYLLGVPLVIHEQNAIVGLTNSWLARIASRVLEAFPYTFPSARHALVVGNPVREHIGLLPPPAERFAERTGRGHLLVIGGSQGAIALNKMVPRAIALLSEDERPEVWHQSGHKFYETAEVAYRDACVEVRLTAFIDDMCEAYSWADLVLCRAGALTVTELSAAGVGSILIPFPFAVDDHQTANARFLENSGAAIVCQQHNLTIESLAELLCQLLSDRKLLLYMAEAARRMAKLGAADQVVMVCLEQV